ncbi:PRTRC system ThiF family protein [Neiella sp. HB171785]|uniref:PRTRC system ThiF family protein n=1 Tax=Neiella litorisoli TaxID=2771431 RepID=A0A8J6QQJ9_9GAMM|nr:PRTRC system ThiF family protein [Neiella litorisoli]MBD1389436.1 PRTRC system ThiF family protein [Neiella litorisoli]
MNQHLFMTPQSWLIRKVPIVIIGAGGTGSELIAQLYKMHFLLKKLGHEGLNIHLMDGDTVSASNVGRQSFWPNDIGLPKSQCLIERFNQFGHTQWTYSNQYAEGDTLNLRGDDTLLITCVDSAPFRVQLYDAFRDTDCNHLWMDSGNGAHDGQVILGHLGQPNSCPTRLPNVMDLYPSLRTVKDNPIDSCSHEEALAKQDFGINIDMASAMRSLLWQLMRYGKTAHHGAYVSLADGQTQPLKIDPFVWSTFGYEDKSSA